MSDLVKGSIGKWKLE